MGRGTNNTAAGNCVLEIFQISVLGGPPNNNNVVVDDDGKKKSPTAVMLECHRKSTPQALLLFLEILLDRDDFSSVYISVPIVRRNSLR